MEHARRAIEIDPGEPRFRQLYSLLLGIQGREGDSYQQLKIARELAPADASILFRMSEKERASGRLATALESLKRASRTDPENPLYHSDWPNCTASWDGIGRRPKLPARPGSSTGPSRTTSKP